MAATWRANTFLLVSFPVGIATFVFLVTAISIGLGLAIVWVGLPILAATLVVSRWLARFERRRVALALAEPVQSGYLTPHRRGMLGWLHTAIVDTATWKDLLWLMILLPLLGLVGFIIAVCAWGTGLGLVTLPAWYSATGDPGVDLGALNVDTLDEAWIGIPVGLVVLTLAVPLTRGAGIGLALLGPRAARPERAPARRRAGAHARGRRRLPGRRAAADRARPPRRRPGAAGGAGDGPRHGPGEARQRPGRARGGSSPGRTGRPSARCPSCATSRAASTPRSSPTAGSGPRCPRSRRRNPVEVALDVKLDDRLPAATEAAAYFVVVEALTNVAKHSGAEHCRVRIVHRRDRLELEVSDDGDGGADPAGAGLTGLRQRVEALDGTLAVADAHPGTTIRAELPCAS